jgi:hypothetical protein
MVLWLPAAAATAAVHLVLLAMTAANYHHSSSCQQLNSFIKQVATHDPAGDLAKHDDHPWLHHGMTAVDDSGVHNGDGLDGTSANDTLMS